jgi:hypothetical protein
MVIGPAATSIAGRSVGVLAGAPGLDRVALTRVLRASAGAISVVTTPEALVEGLRAGRFEVGVTEAFLAGSLAAANGWTARWLPGDLERYPLAIGLWKGDLTLKRALTRALTRLEREGVVRGIIGRYTSREPAPAG